MVSLTRISEYVAQTANIIGGVLELDVLIVDRSLRIIGDSDLASVSEEECIRKDSILAKVMAEKEQIILSSKEHNAGCASCLQRNLCMVEMIIGIPIFFESKILGSIGIIANTLYDKEKMINNQENYLKFIDRMIELLTNRLKEEQALEEISLLKKRMEVVLDSIDDFLVLVSRDGEILQTNLNFKNIFKRKKPKYLNEVLCADVVDQLLNDSEEVKFKEVKVNKIHDFLLSSKPVIVDQKDHGALLSFKSIKDVAVEMNELYTHSMDVVFDDLVGESPQINMVKERIKQIASSSSTVLIDGETGTGKEVIARLIHNTSTRSNAPFVAINCSAIPEDLMESELFGYEEGAFSGAKKGGKIGKFQLASGGTIFLDEIGEMALHLQSKLLRVLQERQVNKIGGLESTEVDVRILAATNKRLEDLVKQGRFREDLYYRLKVIPITSPPLRERKDDIRLLVDYFISYYASRIGKDINGISDNAMGILMEHPWKGNVRELRNVIEFSINMSTGDMITQTSLPFDLVHPTQEYDEDLNIEVVTQRLIEKALIKYGDSTIAKEMAAKSLGISVATLYRKMKELDLKNSIG
ncbi:MULTISPECIES: sigma-54-dependent Fis family transcriptional regulator [unclassified Fusibacter]|uniref:sigma-54 interaction domain-containing protein n=1 Tax=unclassified Fusibacter TaxID=2624464 RepID=UPI00101119D4|nr:MULTISPECIES: sigma 54-interacting transcriptional regulator [unclassified Fusibacter]MCK8060756.1 sigma 54-interacting transcriptional regulator [Fusibacter sp. A2]NPE23052.1 sigma 54-interacting transcriptional regulator [Fusibacter sp. A1]RXV59724.1 AAA family ATPase [Fusibacter sp. A1]